MCDPPHRMSGVVMHALHLQETCSGSEVSLYHIPGTAWRAQYLHEQQPRVWCCQAESWAAGTIKLSSASHSWGYCCRSEAASVASAMQQRPASCTLLRLALMPLGSHLAQLLHHASLPIWTDIYGLLAQAAVRPFGCARPPLSLQLMSSPAHIDLSSNLRSQVHRCNKHRLKQLAQAQGAGSVPISPQWFLCIRQLLISPHPFSIALCHQQLTQMHQNASLDCSHLLRSGEWGPAHRAGAHPLHYRRSSRHLLAGPLPLCRTAPAEAHPPSAPSLCRRWYPAAWRSISTPSLQYVACPQLLHRLQTS